MRELLAYRPPRAESLPLLFPGSKVPGRVMKGAPNDVAIDWDAALKN